MPGTWQEVEDMIVLLFLVYLAIIAFEVPRLIKKKQWRDLIAFSVFMALAVAISLPLALGVKLPNPTKLIAAVFGPLSERVLGVKPKI